MNEELYHYGVKGMKWGVRRDYRVLANHRQNEARRKVKNDYEAGKITKDEKKQRMREAKQTKKNLHAEMKTRFRNAKTKEERTALNNKIKEQAINEVPIRRVKKGINTVNKLITVGNISGALVTAGMAAAATPAIAPLALTSAGVVAASQLGRQAVVQWLNDRAA